MQLTKVIFVVGCLVAAVGSLIQAKLVLNQLNAPLLTACICSVFLVICGVVQRICSDPSDTRKTSVSRLVLIVLHFADITTFFVAINYSTVPIIAALQLVAITLWQFSNSQNESTKLRGIARLVFGFGIVALLCNPPNLDPDQLGWYILEIASAAVYAFINYYLHHYVQRWVDHSQYLQCEIYASCSAVGLLAPFAWLELNTTDLVPIDTSSLLTSISLLCLLMVVYRRSGQLFNSLSHPGTTKFVIASTVSAIIITSIGSLSPLLIMSTILLAISAYLSSLDPPEEGSTESRAKLNFLLALCLALLMFHCAMVLATNMADSDRVELNQGLPGSSLKPLPLDPIFELNRLICLRKIRERVVHEVGSRIVDGKPYAFMDYPMHWNLGDNLIWHGTQTIFEIRGQFPIVTDPDSQRWGQNITAAKMLIKDGVVMCQGGGNFGDIWRGATTFRHNAVKEFKDNTVIFLPQSISYSNMNNVRLDNVTFQSNNRTLFMFRDYPSLEYSQNHFSGKKAMYVPDLAFGLGPQTPNGNPVVDIILLLRVDKEKIVKIDQRKEALKKLGAANVTFEVWDFPVLGLPIKLDKENKTIYNYTKIYPKQLLKLRHNNRHEFMGFRSLMANNLFSRGRLIITDRLHASIMSTLMGKPMIYLDNSYKKITNVRGALTSEFSECSDENLHARHVETLPQAAELALKILSGEVQM